MTRKNQKRTVMVGCLILIAAFVFMTSNIGLATTGRTYRYIAAGFQDSFAIDTSGTSYCWGSGINWRGELGDGTTNMRLSPVLPLLLGNVSSVYSGYNVTFFIGSNGSLWSCGDNQYGVLGDGTTRNRTTIGSVMPFDGSTLPGHQIATAVSSGDQHALALNNSGIVFAWGNNTHGQLGDGTTNSHYLPIQVSGLTNVIAIAAGGEFSLALKNDGTVWAWGDNTYGQLGDGTTTMRTVPVQVPGLGYVVKIDAGSAHSMALQSIYWGGYNTKKTVYTWGCNNNGRLGDGTTTERHSPVAVFQYTNQGSMSISAGDSDCFAANSVNVWAWGSDLWGQLGDGADVSCRTPKAIGLTGVTQISAGYGYTLALKSDGTILAWGGNQYGALGNGTRTIEPVLVPTPSF